MQTVKGHIDIIDKSFIKIEIIYPTLPSHLKGWFTAKVLNMYFGDHRHYWQKEDSVGVESEMSSFVKESDVQKELVIKTIFKYAESYI